MTEKKSYALIDRTTLPFLLVYLSVFAAAIYTVYFLI